MPVQIRRCVKDRIDVKRPTFLMPLLETLKIYRKPLSKNMKSHQDKHSTHSHSTLL